MNSPPRSRIIHSLSLSLLQQEVTALLREGWTTVGVPALAQPIDRTCPAYWVQALHFQAKGTQEAADLDTLPESHSA